MLHPTLVESATAAHATDDNQKTRQNELLINGVYLKLNTDRYFLSSGQCYKTKR